MYTYVDGNNNIYTITPDSINYEPITPDESSSGEYSGGEPKKVQISEQQFLRIEVLIKSILTAKEIQQKNREMGCGTLLAGKKTIYINSSSQQKADLENELKSVLNK